MEYKRIKRRSTDLISRFQCIQWTVVSVSNTNMSLQIYHAWNKKCSRAHLIKRNTDYFLVTCRTNSWPGFFHSYMNSSLPCYAAFLFEWWKHLPTGLVFCIFLQHYHLVISWFGSLINFSIKSTSLKNVVTERKILNWKLCWEKKYIYIYLAPGWKCGDSVSFLTIILQSLAIFRYSSILILIVTVLNLVAPVILDPAVISGIYRFSISLEM